MKNLLFFAIVSTAGLLSGCAALSGVGGSDKFSCPAPDGISCKSVSEVYTMLSDKPEGEVKRQSGTGRERAPQAREAVYRESSSGQMYSTSVAPATGEPIMPLRTPPRVLRIWYAPWVDAQQTLHDQSYSYVQVDDGRWLVEKKQDAIRARYAPGENPVKKTATPPVAAPLSTLPAASISLPITRQDN